MIRKYLGFDLSEYRDPNMIRGILYGSLGACADAIPWFLVAFGLPYILAGGDGKLAGILMIILGVIFFSGGLLFKIRSLAANYDATYAMVSHTRLRLANHLAKLPLGRIISQRDGAWAELITSQFRLYQDVVTAFWGNVVAGFALPVLLWLLLLWLNWVAAIVVLLSLPFAIICVPFAYRLLDRAVGKYTLTQQDASANVLEVITGARDLLFFDMDGQRVIATLTSLKNLRDDALKADVAPAPALLLFSLVIYIGAALAICAVSIQFVAHENNPVMYFMAILVTFRLAAALTEIAPHLAIMRFVGTILKRIRQALSEPVMPQIIQSLTPEDGTIEIKNVSFGYDGEDVVHDICLQAKSGEMIALVGPSGAGKSTLAALVARLWDVKQGKIRIGGVDIRDMDEKTLHKTVSMVLQDVVLFPMTVADNISLGKFDASIEEVIKVAKAACIHDRIMQLPKGYDTVLETGEVLLSGGERQRIAIARAILKDASVLILDEATANLDVENEAAVQQALANLCREKTTFVIAHRLWTIQDADEIYVMENGKIAEHGSHAELLLLHGLYAKLWEAQNTNAYVSKG